MVEIGGDGDEENDDGDDSDDDDDDCDGKDREGTMIALIIIASILGTIALFCCFYFIVCPSCRRRAAKKHEAGERVRLAAQGSGTIQLKSDSRTPDMEAGHNRSDSRVPLNDRTNNTSINASVPDVTATAK